MYDTRVLCISQSQLLACTHFDAFCVGFAGNMILSEAEKYITSGVFSFITVACLFQVNHDELDNAKC